MQNVVLKNLKYKHLLMRLVVRNVKGKYRRSALGVLWTVLHPLLNMLVMTMVFSQIFNRVEYYPIYLMSGSLLFGLHREITNSAMNSINANASLINRVYVPKMLFPVASAMTGLTDFGFSLIAFLGVVVVLKFPLGASALMIIPILPSILMFSLGIGLVLAALNVFFRDVGHLYGIVLTLWMYLTPIFYPITSLSTKMQKIVMLNPMHHYIQYFRDITLNGIVPSFGTHLLCYGMGIASLLIGVLVFNSLKNKFVLYL